MTLSNILSAQNAVPSTFNWQTLFHEHIFISLQLWKVRQEYSKKRSGKAGAHCIHSENSGAPGFGWGYSPSGAVPPPFCF